MWRRLSASASSKLRVPLAVLSAGKRFVPILMCLVAPPLVASCSLAASHEAPLPVASASPPPVAPLPPPPPPPPVATAAPLATALPPVTAVPEVRLERHRVGAIRTARATASLPPAESDTFALHVAPVQPAYHVVEVDFATDRTRTGTRGAEILFSGKRGDLLFGQAIVTIPFTHRPGIVEAPAWWDIRGPSSARDFTIEHETVLTGNAWESALQAAAARSGRNAVLLFVHGYKNGFDDALFRTAQIAYDVHFRGAVAMFSWPSNNNLAQYPADYNNAEWSLPDFEAAMKRVIAATHSSEIYIIAHSMGNQVVTRGLMELARQDPSVRGRVRELILAAPDVDASTFKRSIAPYLSEAAQRTTLYASSRDYALAASRHLQGYVRAGDTSQGVTVVPPVETIDASLANVDLLGHSYVADSPSVLGDVAAVINEHLSPLQRKLVPRHDAAGNYWVYQPH